MAARKRCDHSRDVCVHEEARTILSFRFQGGKLVDDHASHSEPTGRYVAECMECGTRVRRRSLGKLPAWARVPMERM